MATIHFIWWGTPTSEKHKSQATDTPKQVALLCKGKHQVVYWCQEAAALKIAPLLDVANTGIKVEPCSMIDELIPKDARADFPDDAGGKFTSAAQKVAQQLNVHNAYAALKDFVSLCVLYSRGGFYFDTTTVIDPDHPDQVPKGLTEPHGPRLVRRPGDFRIHYHQVGLMTARAIVYGTDTGVMPEVTLPACDVWGMYAPKNHAAIRLALESYVARCYRMGVYTGGKPANFDGVDGNEILSGSPDTRNKLLGNLIIRAVYDGFLTHCCKNGDPADLVNYTWHSSDKFSEKQKATGAQLGLPDTFGLLKVHGGTWRYPLTATTGH